MLKYGWNEYILCLASISSCKRSSECICTATSVDESSNYDHISWKFTAVMMVVMLQKHKKIVSLSEHMPKTFREISKIICISIETVSWIIKQNKETGSIFKNQIGKCGQKRKQCQKMTLFYLHKVRNTLERLVDN